MKVADWFEPGCSDRSLDRHEGGREGQDANDTEFGLLLLFSQPRQSAGMWRVAEALE
jgi:hypothetical protein